MCPALPVDDRSFAGGTKTSEIRFNPTGPRERARVQTNPRELAVGPVVMAARFFVGFNVGDVETWDLATVKDMWLALRTEQLQREAKPAVDPSASIISQTGIYGRDKRGKIVEENGCQIICIRPRDTGERQSEFEDNMTDIAEELCRRLRQESVWVDVQRNGISRRLWRVTP